MKRMIAVLLVQMLLLTACAAPNAAISKKNEAPVEGNDYNAEVENESGEATGKIWPWENPNITLPAFTGSVTAPGTIKSLKILVAGDASARDAWEFFPLLAKEAGIEEIKIGLLYSNNNKGDLATHARYPSYTYYENVGDGWVKGDTNAKMYDALISDKWDYFILNQSIANSGNAESINGGSEIYLTSILKSVSFTLTSKSSSNLNPNKNPNAKILWMQTWAYENNNRNNLFNNFKAYGNDQQQMYAAINDAIKQMVVTNAYISKVATNISSDGVIPVGTAIQNMRNAYWSDGLTRDAEYLSTTGKVIAAVTMFKSLTGYDINDMELSDPAFDHARPHMIVIKESANNAYLNPYAVTPSVYNTAE